MKTKTKIIAFVISLVMLVGMIPFAVFAEESEASAQSKIVLDGVNITLGEEIAINYYLTLGEDEINSLTANFAYGEKNKTVRLADAEKTENGVKLTVGLNVLEMAETVTLTFVDAEGAQVEFNTASSETAISAYTYSVKQYVESILARKSSSDELKAAAKSLLTYAHFAETYFGGEVSTNFDDVMTESDKAIGDVEFTDFTFTIYGDADLLGEGKLVLDDFAKIRISLNVDSEPVVTSEDAELKVLNIDGKYHVDICGITVSDFNKIYTLYINGSETKINLLSVASIVANDVETYGDDFANLAKAIYVYYHSVNNFVAVKNTIVYNVNGGTLPTDAPTEYDPSAVTKLPEDVTKTNAAFSGWYTTEDLEVGTKLRSIPANYGDKVTLYAKWCQVLEEVVFGEYEINNPSETQRLQDSAGKDICVLGYKEGVTYKVVEENNQKYLKWELPGTTERPEIDFRYNGSGWKNVDDNCISFSLELARDATGKCAPFRIRLRQTHNTSGGSSKKDIALIKVSNTGRIQFSDNTNIATIGAGSSYTLRIVIDMEDLQVRAYNEDYSLIGNYDFTISGVTKGVTPLETIKACFQEELINLYADASTAGVLRIYNVKSVSGDMFAE